MSKFKKIDGRLYYYKGDTFLLSLTETEWKDLFIAYEKYKDKDTTKSIWGNIALEYEQERERERG